MTEGHQDPSTPNAQGTSVQESYHEGKQEDSQEGEKTVVEAETVLGPTQSYQPSPHLLRTPIKSAFKEVPPDTPKRLLNPESPSPEPCHIPTDVTMEDGEYEEYEQEKLMWETWQQTQLIQLKHKTKRLEWEKVTLESRLFPSCQEWFRNKQLALATEKAEGRLHYSNQEPFGGPRWQLENQMIGREIKRKFAEISKRGMDHPSLKAQKAMYSSKSDGL